MSSELGSACRYHQKIVSNLAGIPGTLMCLDDIDKYDLSLPFHTKCCLKDSGGFDDTRFICTIVICCWANTESVGLHKPLHSLSLLLRSAYEETSLPLLE